MAETLPPDFDADAYAAAYPDVALSGLSPRLHYLRFGRVLGRSPSGQQGSPAAAETVSENAPAPQRKGKNKAATGISRTGPRKEASDGIIDAPDGFEAWDAVPGKAPPRRSAGGSGRFTLEELAAGPFAPEVEQHQVCAPLFAYARIFSLPVTGVEAEVGATASICNHHFRSSPARIDNAWLAEPSLLRLMIAGGSGDRAASGWSIRAYQGMPGDPSKLHQAGSGILLPRLGPSFVDFKLVHGLMPVILELADEDGQVRGFALLPFPSLLPHGLHWGELKVLQADANPMDAFWSLSENFLNEHLGGPERPARALGRIAVRSGLDAAMTEWLELLFGISVEREVKRREEGEHAVLEVMSAAADQLRLILPDSSVPTIGILVSRNLQLNGAANATGPYIVAEAVSFRPRWSVALPPSFVLARKKQRGSRQRSQPGAVSSPVHLAIVHEEQGLLQAGESTRVSMETPGQAPPPTTIVLDASQPQDAQPLVSMLKEVMAGSACDLLVRLPTAEGGLRAALDGVWGANGWGSVPADVDLPAIARSSPHPRLLTIGAGVRVTVQTLKCLLKLLDDYPDAASLSCLLLQEATIKKQVVLHPGFGGFFPAGASFTAGPRLAFAEPDVSLALAGKVYPVVANRFDLTVWRCDLLTALEPTSNFATGHSDDLRLGLALTKSGHSNLCTTIAQARIAGQSARRDLIDPFGPGYAGPADWAWMLERVTVLQELF